MGKSGAHGKGDAFQELVLGLGQVLDGALQESVSERRIVVEQRAHRGFADQADGAFFQHLGADLVVLPHEQGPVAQRVPRMSEAQKHRVAVGVDFADADHAALDAVDAAAGVPLMVDHLAGQAGAGLLGVVDALEVFVLEDAPFGALPRLAGKTVRENGGTGTPFHQTVSRIS